MSTANLPTSLPIPLLETDRLLLRGHRPEDFDDCKALWGDPDVTRHIGGRPLSGEEVWTRLLRYLGHWCWLGYGFWVVAEKATGRFVGEVGFADLKRDLEPSLGGDPEAGWVLAPRAHGQGYATEAVQAVLAWGKTRFGSARTVCLISTRQSRLDPGRPEVRVSTRRADSLQGRLDAAVRAPAPDASGVNDVRDDAGGVADTGVADEHPRARDQLGDVPAAGIAKRAGEVGLVAAQGLAVQAAPYLGHDGIQIDLGAIEPAQQIVEPVRRLGWHGWHATGVGVLDDDGRRFSQDVETDSDTSVADPVAAAGDSGERADLGAVPATEGAGASQGEHEPPLQREQPGARQPQARRG